MDIDVSERIRFTLSFFMFILSIYTILFIFVKGKVTFRGFKLVYIGVIIFAFVAIIYSWITEFDKYIEIFNGDILRITINSFFWNGNMFVGFLYFATISAVILNIIKKNPLWYIIIILLMFEILLTVSSLSIISEILIVFAYFLVEIIYSFRKHKVRSTVFLIIYLLSLNNFLIFFFLGREMDNPVAYIFTRIYHEIFETNQHSRDYIWQNCIEYLGQNPLSLVFGVGFGISKEVCTALSNVPSAHNGFVQVLFNYGIVGVLAYSSILTYFVISFFKLIKKKTRFALMFLIIGIGTLGYAIGESIIFFNSNAMGIIVGALFYVPLMLEAKNEKHNENRSYLLTLTEKPKLANREFVIRIVSIICLALFCAVFPLLFIPSVRFMEELFFILLSAAISLFIIYLILPYLITLWFKNTCLRNGVYRTIINCIFIIIFLALGIVLSLVWREKYAYVYNLFIPTSLAVVLIAELGVYVIVKHGSFKDYFVTIKALVTNCLFAVLFSIIPTLCIIIFLGDYFEYTLLYMIILIVMSLTLYHVGLYTSRLGNNQEIIDYLNERSLQRVRNHVLKNEEMR